MSTGTAPGAGTSDGAATPDGAGTPQAAGGAGGPGGTGGAGPGRAGAAPPTDGTTPAPTWRQRLRRRRGVVALVVAVLLVAALTAWLGRGGTAGLLDPAATDRSGSAALAAVLREQGVQVTTARTAEEALAAGPGSTLFVARPERLDATGLFAVTHGGADVVLAQPQDRVLGALLPGAREASGVAGAGPAPACPLPAAVRAGEVDVGAAYVAPPGVLACYPGESGAGLLVGGPTPGGGRVVAVADTDPFTNAALGDRGNAALALGLLGAAPRLVWYLPSPAAAGEGEQSLGELVPAGWWWGGAQLAVAAVLAALWRGRRFGSVVGERLPVTVPATETTAGRARLYRRSGARDRAAGALRAETARVLAARLGLPPAAGYGTLAGAVAGATGRDRAGVTAVLAGPTPADDAALVALAGELDALRAAVADPHPPTPGAP